MLAGEEDNRLVRDHSDFPEEQDYSNIKCPDEHLKRYPLDTF